MSFSFGIMFGWQRRQVAAAIRNLLGLPLQNYTFDNSESSKFDTDYRGVLIEGPVGEPFFEGARRDGTTWQPTTADGLPLVNAADYPTERPDSTAVVAGEKYYVLGTLTEDAVTYNIRIALVATNSDTTDASPPALTEQHVALGTYTEAGGQQWEIPGYATLEGWVNEDEATNKITARKYAPVDFANIITPGTYTLSIIDDSTLLSQSGLGEICSGSVYDIDNTGQPDSYIQFGGAVGNTNPHSGLIYAVCLAGSATLRFSVGEGMVGFSHTDKYRPIKFENVTPGSTGRLLTITIPADAHIRCILPNLVESSNINSPIINAASDDLAPVVRPKDQLSFATPSVWSAENWAFRLVVTPGATGQAEYLLTNYTDANNEVSVISAAGTITLRKRNGGVDVDLPFTYTHTAGTTMVVDAYGDSSAGMGLSVYDYGSAQAAFQTNSNTDSATLGTLWIGSQNATNIFDGEFIEATPYKSKAAAGW